MVRGLGRVSPYSRSLSFDRRSPRRAHLSPHFSQSPDHLTSPIINTSPYSRIADNGTLESGSGEHWEGSPDMWRTESCKQSLMARNAARRLKFERKEQEQPVVIKTEKESEMDQRIMLAENTSHLMSNPLMTSNASLRSNSHFLSVPQDCGTRSPYSPRHSMSPRDHNLNHSPHPNYQLAPNHGVPPHISETPTFPANCQQT
jgi:hypothetical protein